MLIDSQKKPYTPDYSYVEMTQMVMPQSTNALGTVFGGQIMSWIDICAAVSAGRHSASVVVTASFDEVHFIYPIKHGQVVILKSQVSAVFNTSMEVETIVIAENILTQERTLAAKALCTFVALDEHSKPKKCPKLIDLTLEQQQIQEDAQKRRALRLTHR